MKNTELKNKIVEIADRNQFTKFSERINSIKPEEIKIKVAFLGEFSSGKSTLINALMKKKLLPTFAEPTTAAITEIQKNTENKIFVIEEQDGEEIQREITLSELAKEVVTAQPNKKIQIFRNDIDFIDDTIHIIDTPGIASINETHTDITYGYLPSVDVAFILMDANIGIGDTLFKFLKKYPNEILSKIYFVFTKSDTKTKEQLEYIKENFVIQLAELIPNPRIYIVSGINAIDSALVNNNENYSKTGIEVIINVIKNEIPELKSEVEEKRIKEILKSETNELKKLLEYKLKSLSWNSDEFDNAIKKLKRDIAEIETEIRKFRQSFIEIKTEIIRKVNKIVSENVELIGTKVTKEEPYEEIVEVMISEIEDQVKLGIQQLKGLKLESLGKNISEIISAAINSETMQIKEIADLVTDISTFILTSLIIPGVFSAGEAAASAGTVAAKKAGQFADETIKATEKVAKNANKVAEVSKGAKFLKNLGKFITALNPLEKAKCFILPYIINPKLRNSLTKKINEKLQIVFESVEHSMNKLIEVQYLQPLTEKEDLLNNSRKDLNNYIKDLENTEKLIKKDISAINLLINNI